jgi:hypothetical protein
MAMAEKFNTGQEVCLQIPSARGVMQVKEGTSGSKGDLSPPVWHVRSTPRNGHPRDRQLCAKGRHSRRLLARSRHSYQLSECPLIGDDRKWLAYRPPQLTQSGAAKAVDVNRR